MTASLRSELTGRPHALGPGGPPPGARRPAGPRLGEAQA